MIVNSIRMEKNKAVTMMVWCLTAAVTVVVAATQPIKDMRTTRQNKTPCRFFVNIACSLDLKVLLLSPCEEVVDLWDDA
jgi:hypothetical protein